MCAPIDVPRVHRSISYDPEQLEWVDKKLEENYHFKDRSHYIEISSENNKEKIEK